MKKSIICGVFFIGATCSYGQMTVSSNKRVPETVPSGNNPEVQQEPADTLMSVNSAEKRMNTEKIPLQKNEENKSPQPLMNNTQKKPE